MHKPSFIILDEPFSGFDPINSNLLKEEILQLKKDGATIILSTHNMASVEEICDEIALINHAQKILEGNIHDVKNRFKKNIYAIELSADSPDITPLLQHPYELIEKQMTPQSTSYTVKIQDNQPANNLLKMLVDHSNILSFNEILPTMNEIFIEQVQTFNQQHHE